MKRAVAIAILGVVAAIASTRADINVIFDSTSSGETTTFWNYTINVTALQIAPSGSFFTIYDFGSIVPNTNVQPAGWTFSTSLLGPTPDKVNAPDDPNVLNLNWTYNGPTIPTASMGIGPFQVQIEGVGRMQFQTSYFAGLGTMSVGPNAGTPIGNISTTVVPVPVPEPSTLALIAGMGGLGMIGRAVARRRKF